MNTLRFCYKPRPLDYLHDRNDCVVRAMASAFALAYEDAHAIARAAGRNYQHGCNLHYALELAAKQGLTTTEIKARDLVKPLCSGQARSAAQIYPTLGAIAPLLAKGRFIIRVRSHAFAVIDGVQYDFSPNGPRKRVHQIYEITARHDIATDALKVIRGAQALLAERNPQ